MRVLLDECLPRRLVADLGEHEVRTVPQAGWASKSNGELLDLADGRFDVFVTVDKGFVSQRDLEGRSLSVIALRAPTNRYGDLLPFVPAILRTLSGVRPGQLVRLGPSRR